MLEAEEGKETRIEIANESDGSHSTKSQKYRREDSGAQNDPPLISAGVLFAIFITTSTSSPLFRKSCATRRRRRRHHRRRPTVCTFPDFSLSLSFSFSESASPGRFTCFNVSLFLLFSSSLLLLFLLILHGTDPPSINAIHCLPSARVHSVGRSGSDSPSFRRLNIITSKVGYLRVNYNNLRLHVDDINLNSFKRYIYN